MMSRITSLFLLLTVCIGMSAQKTKKVRGEYTYYAPENVSLEEAKRTALERAKIQLIAEEFGTVVAQTNTTFVENTDGKSSVDFQSLAASEVKGEWIETIGDPKYHISYEQNMLIVKVEVEGRIREIKSAKVNFTAKILRNGTEEHFESSEFKDGDSLYLSFISPIDGYLSVYQLDTNGDAYCLLPYPGDTDGKVFVEHGKRYVLFSFEHKSETDKTPIHKYYMTCAGDREENYIYIIFSPEKFVKGSDVDINNKDIPEWKWEHERPRMLSNKDFQNWLERCRRRDKEMAVEVRQITIRK